MVKKIASIVGAGALLLGSATPAFAWHMPKPSTSTTSFASVTTKVSSSAVSGRNTQTNSAVFGKVGFSSNALFTGPASSIAGQETQANNSDCNLCSSNSKNTAFVNTTVSSSANSGYNTQENTAVFGSVFGSKNVSATGAASSQANSWTVVNSSVVMN